MTGEESGNKPVRPAAQAELRASDADRERVVDLLREAFAEGRLTAEEHSERVDAAYAAKTHGELVPLTRDLPARQESAAAPSVAAERLPEARSESPTVVAVFGGATRQGRWRVGRGLKAVAVFGGIEIDMTEAVFDEPEVVISCTAVFGGISIRVPESVSLQGGGAGIFGGVDVRQHEAAEPGAPVVRVRGAAIFGGVDAKPKRRRTLRDVKDAVRKRLEG